MVTISFIGDISLNDEYVSLHQNGVQPFHDLSQDLNESDLVVGNLECLTSGSKGENIKKKPRLKTDPDTLDYLKQINLGLACLANNHVYDNLEDGFRQTTDFLTRNSIPYIGATLDNSKKDSAHEISINGIRFAFLNYVAQDTNPGLPPDAGIHLSILDQQRVIEDIGRLSDIDYKILVLHWGGNYENSYFPGPDQIMMAREFIDAGADLLIGHHSHTLQPSYRYNKKSVYFSLGNFCFSDIKSDDRIKEIKYRRWKESSVLKIHFTKETYHSSMVYFRLDNLHTIKDPFLSRGHRRRGIYFKFILFSRVFWFIYYFGYKYIRPVIWELNRKEPDRSMLKRLFGLNLKKIRGMFK